MTIDEIVDDFYSLPPKHKTKKRLKEMLRRKVCALETTIDDLNQEIRERNEREE